MLVFIPVMQLLPSDSDMQQHQQKELQEAKAYARRLNTIVLGEKKEEEKEKEEVHKPEMVGYEQCISLVQMQQLNLSILFVTWLCLLEE